MARVLVIEDDPAVLSFVVQVLEGSGHEVVEAQDGRVGIRLFRSDPVDLVITDILMPEKDGVEVIMELVEKYPSVKIIAISGGGHGLDAGFNLRVAQDFGALRVLAKPFSRRELLEAVDELVAM